MRTARLDDVLKEDSIGHVDVIKIDIEGAELFALQGMPELLSKSDRPVIILEMNAKMMHDAGYGSNALLDLLAPYGYRCYEFVKNGLLGPLQQVNPVIENYRFLTDEQLNKPRIKDLILPVH